MNIDSIILATMVLVFVAGIAAMIMLPRWGITKDDVSVIEQLNRKRKMSGRLIIK